MRPWDVGPHLSDGKGFMFRLCRLEECETLDTINDL